jgi:hypothetical protein
MEFFVAAEVTRLKLKNSPTLDRATKLSTFRKTATKFPFSPQGEYRDEGEGV